ncbi:MAG TPA: YIP1 family protein [Thermoanaerobaculia bacterium]|nr:YIP1 family protein [Thermoanaerobaculia bacterium]
MGPSLKDLFAIVVRPRETMRRILDSGSSRWTAQIVILAFICTSIGDSDLREMQRTLPGLALMPTLATVILALLAGAVVWVLLLYLFAWGATLVGRRLEGQAAVADVRAALAWGLVPLIWSAIIRIPLAIYRNRFILHGSEGRVLTSFIEQGGCTFAILLLTVQLVVNAGVVVLASFCLAEALRVPSWKGFATIAITAAIPVVIAVAAVLAFKT